MSGVRALFRKSPWIITHLVLLSLLSFAPQAGAVTITWTGNAGGGSWHTPGNWDLNRVPGSGDDVVINNLPGTTLVTYSSTGTHVNSLTCAENFSLSGGQLLLMGPPSSKSGSFTFFSAELSGNGDLNITGSFSCGATGRKDVRLLADFGLIEIQEVGPGRAAAPKAKFTEIVLAA